MRPSCPWFLGIEGDFGKYRVSATLETPVNWEFVNKGDEVTHPFEAYKTVLQTASTMASMNSANLLAFAEFVVGTGAVEEYGDSVRAAAIQLVGKFAAQGGVSKDEQIAELGLIGRALSLVRAAEG